MCCLGRAAQGDGSVDRLKRACWLKTHSGLHLHSQTPRLNSDSQGTEMEAEIKQERWWWCGPGGGGGVVAKTGRNVLWQ